MNRSSKTVSPSARAYAREREAPADPRLTLLIDRYLTPRTSQVREPCEPMVEQELIKLDQTFRLLSQCLHHSRLGDQGGIDGNP